MRVIVFLCAAAATVPLTGGALSQTPPRVLGELSSAPETKAIWDIPLGTPIAEVPRSDFAEPACQLLSDFAAFSSCRKDADTGLFEVAFIYDDEREYLARATRDPSLIQAWSANQILGQPVLLSYLVDDEGLIEGYRIVTDDKAADSVRHNAYILGQIFFKSRFGDDGWACITAEPGPGERAIGQRFISDRCTKTVGETRVTVDSRFYYRAGQSLMDPRTNTLTVGLYVSTARLEVINLRAIDN
jgi:hypothetical protein